mgnify:CR=1 FL=1
MSAGVDTRGHGVAGVLVQGIETPHARVAQPRAARGPWQVSNRFVTAVTRALPAGVVTHPARVWSSAATHRQVPAAKTPAPDGSV